MLQHRPSYGTRYIVPVCISYMHACGVRGCGYPGASELLVFASRWQTDQFAPKIGVDLSAVRLIRLFVLFFLVSERISSGRTEKPAAQRSAQGKQSVIIPGTWYLVPGTWFIQQRYSAKFRSPIWLTMIHSGVPGNNHRCLTVDELMSIYCNQSSQWSRWPHGSLIATTSYFWSTS